MKTHQQMRVASVLVIIFLFIGVFVAAIPVTAKDTPNSNSQNSNTTYQTVPITIQMEAGRSQWNPWSTGSTWIAGTGWVAPFGRGNYHYGVGFAEATDELKPDFMDDASWSTPYPTGKLCIYHLADGDIYAYDGIVANLEPASTDGKCDYLLEVIVGGTGAYKNSNGILLGRTAGRGTGAVPTYDGETGPIPLPEVLVKVMEGYINVVVKKSKYNPSLPAVGTKNPQKWPEVFDALDALAAGSSLIIPINIEMEAGRAQWNSYDSGTTIIAGTGWVEPFGRSSYHYGYGYEEDTDELKPDFMEDSSWSTPYPTQNLCIYHMANGDDLYAYDGIVGNLAPATDDGKSDYILEVIAGGTGYYEGATGILLGQTFGRGEAETPSDGDDTAPYPLPESIVKIMEGYIIVKGK